MSSQFSSPRVPNFGRGQFGQFSPYRDSPQGDPGQQDSHQSPMDQAIAPRGVQQSQQPDSSSGYSGPSTGSRTINDGRTSYFPSADAGNPYGQSGQGDQSGAGQTIDPGLIAKLRELMGGNTGPTSGLGLGSYTNGSSGQLADQSQSGDSGSGMDTMGLAIAPGMSTGGADFNLAQQLGIDTSNPLWRQILLQMMSQSQGGGQPSQQQQQYGQTNGGSVNPYLKFL